MKFKLLVIVFALFGLQINAQSKSATDTVPEGNIIVVDSLKEKDSKPVLKEIKTNKNTNYEMNDQALSISSGYTQHGLGILGSLDVFLGTEHILEIGVYFSTSEDRFKDQKIPYNSYTLNLNYYRLLLATDNNAFRFFGGVGIQAGYELLNNNNKELPNGALIQDNSKFLYGASISSELEYVLGDYTSMILKLTEFYQPSSDIGNFVPYIGIGLRYIIFNTPKY